VRMCSRPGRDGRLSVVADACRRTDYRILNHSGIHRLCWSRPKPHPTRGFAMAFCVFVLFSGCKYGYCSFGNRVFGGIKKCGRQQRFSAWFGKTSISSRRHFSAFARFLYACLASFMHVLPYTNSHFLQKVSIIIVQHH
jgi:hypothetical protein